MDNTSANIKHPLVDSLIFDMDGTLWNAVDSYALIWNRTIEQAGIRDAGIVTPNDLIALMGMHLEDIMAHLIPQYAGDSRFLELLDENERTMMPVLGGKLYPGVTETLTTLHQRVPLFMVSNCGADGLDNFLDYTHLRPLFMDWLTHGGTGLNKGENIAAIIKKYGLKHAYYVGDTRTDALSAHQAHAGMIWARYGFGNLDNEDYDYAIDSITDLTSLIRTK